MPGEERRFTRVPFNGYTEIKTKDAIYTSNVIGNLSIGGCLLPVKCDVVPGTDCKILIRLEGNVEDIDIRIKGQILRRDSHSVAVKFNLIDPDSLYQLQNIIRCNSKNPDTVENEFSRQPGLI